MPRPSTRPRPVGPPLRRTRAGPARPPVRDRVPVDVPNPSAAPERLSRSDAQASLASNPVETTTRIRRVHGRLPDTRRKAVRTQVGAVVDRWWDAAYLGGTYPRSSFPSAFPGFTDGAEQRARADKALLTNQTAGPARRRGDAAAAHGLARHPRHARDGHAASPPTSCSASTARGSDRRPRPCADACSSPTSGARGASSATTWRRDRPDDLTVDHAAPGPASRPRGGPRRRAGPHRAGGPAVLGAVHRGQPGEDPPRPGRRHRGRGRGLDPRRRLRRPSRARR